MFLELIIIISNLFLMVEEDQPNVNDILNTYGVFFNL